MLGSAVALNLLFHIPLLWAVIITGLDVLLLLALQRFGMRTIEAVVLLLVATIGVCYFIEIFVLPADPAELPGDGPRAARRRASARRAWSTWPSASSAPRSCRTISTCTRRWCRAGKLQKDDASIRARDPVQHDRLDRRADASRSSSTPPSWCWRRWSSTARRA